MNIYKNIIKSNGNIKLGSHMGTISKIYGNKEIYVEKLGCCVRGTCGKYCAGCDKACYVRASYRYGSVILGHAKTTLAFRQDIARAFAEMDLQLSRKRKPFKQVRINQSGEIESTEELTRYYWLARKHPESDFYLYTKNFDALRESLILEKLPKNITILISVWHEYGLAVFNEYKHIPNIKAFVYVDDTWNAEKYAENGIVITTWCKAYDERGKLDHNITCDKCHKCFDRLGSHKVVGCHAH